MNKGLENVSVPFFSLFLLFLKLGCIYKKGDRFKEPVPNYLEFYAKD